MSEERVSVLVREEMLRQSELRSLEQERELLFLHAQAEVQTLQLDEKAKEHRLLMERKEDVQRLALELDKAKVDAVARRAEAVSPHLVEALHRLGDEALLSKLSDNFSEMAAVGGKGLLVTAKKFLDFVPQSLWPALRAENNGLNGHAPSAKLEHDDEHSR
ncbi:MAG: hypothetical protein GY822_27965 [Deltaproteobacteria bacterium]|nr:hypothetical protein [Deltaproteobacteria bacterium]